MVLVNARGRPIRACSRRARRRTRAKVLEPIRDNVDPPSLEHLCEKYGIADKAMASNMIFTVKRQFQALLRRHVRELVDSDAEVDEESRERMAIFSGAAAISPPD